jgi:hypothetical protein
MDSKLTAEDIKKRLAGIGGYGNIFIPEYTWKQIRIDAVIIDIRKRWVRGFEVKTSRIDFLQDDKWTQYSEFCSSVSIVCPEGLIEKNEVQKPFGLLWIKESVDWNRQRDFQWVRRPKNIQNRKSLAWFWTYLNVIERELPRMYYEIDSFKRAQMVRK